MSKPDAPALKAETTSNAPQGVFVSTLAAMHGGKVLQDLDEAIREVTKHVNESQAKGKLTLELTIAPNGLGAGDTPLLKVEDKVKVSLPKKPRPPQSFFADEDMNLTRRNPNQEEMKLTVVAGEPLQRPIQMPKASNS